MTTYFILSPSFKVARKGTHAEPSTAAGEFVYTDDSDMTMGQLQDIAKANGLEVHGKKKADFQANLNAELAKMSVAEQNQQTETQIVEDIVKAGNEKNKSDDDMMIEIIENGISFKKAGRLFKQALENLGLRASTKTVKENAEGILEDMEFNPLSFDDVEKAVVRILDEVEGAERKQAMTAIRGYCKENELELPAKPKGRRGGGGFRGKVYDFIVGNPNATPDDIAEMAERHGKDPERIKKQFAPVLQLCRDFAKKHGAEFAESE